MMPLLTLSARIRMDRTTAGAKVALYGTVLIVKVQHDFYDKYLFFLFSVGEREEFNKSCNVIGFGSGCNFPLLLFTEGGIVVLIHFHISAKGQSFAFLHFHRRLINASLSLFTFKWQGKSL